MQENIYAAPEADLISTDDHSVQPAFYIVSPVKFITLFLFTFSLYGVYWHFKNWKQYKIAYNDKAPMPVMRAIFSVFFTHTLFAAVDKRIKDQNINYQWMPAFWAVVAVCSIIISRIIDRFSANGTFNEFIEFIPLCLIIVYGLALLQAQLAINASCNAPEGKFNRNFTLANCVWIFLGTIFYSLIAIGIFVPDTFTQ